MTQLFHFKRNENVRTQDLYTNIDSSNIRKSQTVATTQMPISSWMGGRRVVCSHGGRVHGTEKKEVLIHTNTRGAWRTKEKSCHKRSCAI